MRISDYLLIEATTISDLSDAVRKEIKKNWKPFASPEIRQDAQYVYSQAVIKSVDEMVEPISDYMLVTASSAEQLSLKVVQQINKEGWEPFEAPKSITNKFSTTIYIQAMIKRPRIYFNN